MGGRKGVTLARASRIAAEVVQDGKSPPERLLRDPVVKRALLIALELAGVTPEKIGSVLRDCLEAMKVETAKHKGAITDEKSYADHAIRLRAAEVCAKILDPPKQEDVNWQPRFSIHLDVEHRQMFFPESPEPTAIDATPKAATSAEVVDGEVEDPSKPAMTALDQSRKGY